VLVADGVCAYEQNPRHRRAQLLALTSQGRRTLSGIETAQREWADALGERMGEAALRRASAALAVVLGRIEDVRWLPPEWCA
jgi:hypothetical protein